jgi:hypothetical protein
MRIRDRQVAAFTRQLQTAAQPKIDEDNVLRLLAAVGDRWNLTATDALARLTAPGVTRKEQLDIAQQGMSSDERRDVIALLDQSGFDMSPGAKNFLEALVGRAPLMETFGALTLVGDQRDGIQGLAKAGDTIEAINLSTAPEGRLHLTDTVAIAKADAFGKFKGTLPDMQEGDLIRMRTRDAAGNVSNWVDVRASGIAAADTRNAKVNLERVDLLALGDGTVEVTQNTARPFSEPGAMLRLTNKRTGEKHDLVVNGEGALPKDLKLPGRAGDDFEVAVSDGTNNANFASSAGVLKVPGVVDRTGVDLPDPAPLKSDLKPDGASRYALARYTGPLYVNGVSPEDVKQGAIGNCYFPAALAAIAHTKPQAIKDAIKDNGDGTYSVRFYSGAGPYRREVFIDVDGDLYSRSYGGPVYGQSLGGSLDKDKMELWYPIIEKAYAQWKGSYEAIGNGGVTGNVMREVLGVSSQHSGVSEHNADRVFQLLKVAEQKGRVATAGTYGASESARYTNSGLYANHAYSVFGVVEDNGQRYVKLRNPWGQSEPGFDGKNDGIFKLELEKFAKYYSGIAISEA